MPAPMVKFHCDMAGCSTEEVAALKTVTQDFGTGRVAEATINIPFGWLIWNGKPICKLHDPLMSSQKPATPQSNGKPTRSNA